MTKNRFLQHVQKSENEKGKSLQDVFFFRKNQQKVIEE